MRVISAALVLLGVACGPLPKPTGSFRDASVPISSTTRFDERRFEGLWYVVADFTGPPAPETRAAFGQFVWRFEARDGPAFGIAKSGVYPAEPQPYRETGVGQFAPDSFMLRNQPPVWVLWIDEDFKTAVIGTPDGSFGAILNRTPALRADRLKAAREILDFNGYDLSKLRMASQG